MWCAPRLGFQSNLFYLYNENIKKKPAIIVNAGVSLGKVFRLNFRKETRYHRAAVHNAAAVHLLYVLFLRRLF